MPVLSKNRIKLIKSLEIRKFRKTHNLFVAEGNKTVTDLLESGFGIKTVIGTKEFLAESAGITAAGIETIEATQEEIKSASFLRQPQQAIALCSIPAEQETLPDPGGQLVICLDNIQDPGNLGTIVRIADWFGIVNLVCSPDTADVYSPKCIQATMGSISRVSIFYSPLYPYLEPIKAQGIAIAGTFLDGDNIYQADLPENGVIIMGNEGKGISGNISELVGRKLLIPSFSTGSRHAESLNVAIATAVVCAEFRRRKFSGLFEMKQ